MVGALLVILLILGFVDQEVFMHILVRVVGVAMVLTVASITIIKMIGTDKHKK